MTLPDEIRWHLAERRAERLYANDPASGLSYGPVKVNCTGDRFWADKGAWVFQFGAYGTTHVLAYGHLEDALEDAAAWLKDNAPGHLTEPDYSDAALDLGLSTQLDRLSDEESERVREAAETDLTHTESGWLLSYEWTCTELVEPSDLLDYVRRYA